MADAEPNIQSYIAQLERRIQVEEAVEKVRVSAMALNHSGDLPRVALIVFQQIEELGLTRAKGCSIAIIDEEADEYEAWFVDHYQDEEISVRTHKATNGSLWLTRQVADLRNDGLKESVIALEGEGLLEWISFQSRHERTVSTIVSEGVEKIYFAFSIFSGGAIVLALTDAPKEEMQATLRRIANAFDLSYTRYLDFKQAEARAREALIEAALERVRTKTMAMHNSEDIAEVSKVLFKELAGLGLTPDRTWISIIDEKNDSAIMWMTGHEAESLLNGFKISMLTHHLIVEIYDAWKTQQPFITHDLSGKALEGWLRWVRKGTNVPFNEIPERRVYGYAPFTYGVVSCAQSRPFPESIHAILPRFAKVFDLTYRRFLDLKEAEARTREAEQKSSLDRIRAGIASMRTSEDLQIVTPLIWQELTTLGVPFYRCGVFIMHDESQTIQSFITTPSGEHLADLTIPYNSAASTLEVVESWRCCEVYTDRWDRQKFIKWSQAMLEQGNVDSSNPIPDFEDPPEFLSLHFVPFAQGMLYVGSDASLSDQQINMVQSLADAFSVAYARYDDFHTLEAKNIELATTLSNLETTQAQLIQSEKMASLGQLTAGIAHEIKNPLNFVNNFSQISLDMMGELAEWVKETGSEENQETLDLLMMNVRKIKEHGERADGIVKSMMQHARGGSGKRYPVAINALIEEYVSLASHSWSGNGHIERLPIISRNYDPHVREVEIVQQEIGQVLVNLLNNAFDAMREKGAGDSTYKPELVISTHQRTEYVEICVSDNGPGIPLEAQEKIFEPFFTTKPSGEGTGLGLSLSYDIITKGHSGKISVESDADSGTTFVISLPV